MDIIIKELIRIHLRTELQLRIRCIQLEGRCTEVI